MTPLRLAVIGDPVAHSKSPELQSGFLAEAGLAGTYEAIRVEAGDGARAIEALRDAGYRGLNVTTPLKEEAFARADTRDPIATATGAVNTLVLGVEIAGYNTDGAGALGALAEAGMGDVAGASILVLGAGPTARAVVCALVARGARVLVWNRTPDRAERVAATLGARLLGPRDAFDAAFATLSPNAEPGDARLLRRLRACPLVVDANYGARATLGTFLGRDVRDGAAMLRASARAAFELFRAR